jgi:threonine aldolase
VPDVIDLRSDACTLPTLAMRQAMAKAAVGNDDFSEDPTVRRLEETVAGLLGKEAAVFVQSGTMGNLVGIMSQVEPGNPVLTSSNFHVVDHEQEAMLRIARCSFRIIGEETREGATRLLMPPSKTNGNGRDVRLLSLENTVNRLGGTLLTLEHLEELYGWAARQPVAVHLDGARLFNAACALEATPAEIARFADTVMVAFTKALSAPVGAALAGGRDVIDRARRFRWMLGGNWKQGGMVAAACLIGMETMVSGIPEDHRRARRLAEGLNSIPGITVDLTRVVTNIILMRIEDSLIDPGHLKSGLEEEGARIGAFRQGNISRLVTHKDIDDAAIDRFLSLVEKGVKSELARFDAKGRRR